MRFSGYFILCFALFSAGCIKSWKRECRKDLPSTTGIILRELDNCNYMLHLPMHEMSITRQSQWDSIWNDPNHPAPSTCEKPDIDFSKESLLVFYTNTNDGVKVFRDVSADDGLKQFVYTIKELDCGNTRRRKLIVAVSHNLVVVPRIPIGWRVRFRTIEE